MTTGETDQSGQAIMPWVRMAILIRGYQWLRNRTGVRRIRIFRPKCGRSWFGKGKYTVCLKDVDTFGCDTSITVEVDS
ncbi:MAG: hypothetical protein K9N52_02335 [Verrucomicrobia bacterium]|nr:hypothetical protein [Verrucomicrobiota bacterium]